MSTIVNLVKTRRLLADYEIADLGTPEACADKCFWQLPLKVFFDDPAILKRFLEHLDDEHAEPPEEIWSITDVRTGEFKIHPTFPQLRDWLSS